METVENAEGQTPSTRGAQKQPNRSSDQQHSESRTRSPGSKSRGERGGGDRTFGQGTVIGGIVARMIADKESRIREVDDCIDWYQKEKQARLAELADLRELEAQLSAPPEAEAEA